MKSKIEIFRAMTEKAADTYERKNADYGDSFAKTRALVPNAILVRLHDKLNRVTSLMLKGDQKVSDESIEDTLLDMANYCLMELTERAYEKQGELRRPGFAKFAGEGQFESIEQAKCDYEKRGFCQAQKGAPRCDSNPDVCDVRRGATHPA